jgi:hypothetical protein
VLHRDGFLQKPHLPFNGAFRPLGAVHLMPSLQALALPELAAGSFHTVRRVEYVTFEPALGAFLSTPPTYGLRSREPSS